MQKVCTQCAAGFEVTDDDLAFYEKMSPVFNGKIELIPAPTLCPECRFQRRLAWRNQIHVYLRPSSMSGKTIFSMYPPESPVPVYDDKEWWGDGWDELSNGRDIDFSRPFFEQIAELSRAAPRPSRSIKDLQNSDYSNNATGLKNCYFVFHTTFAEDCMYCERTNGAKDCIDCTYSMRCELCYDCTACNRCYNTQHCEECDDCIDSSFMLNCRSCRNCFGCVNLRHKQYCLFNEQLSKEDYEAALMQWNPTSISEYEAMRRRVDEFIHTHPRPHVVTHLTENVSGNYIFESRAIEDSRLIWQSENLRYCHSLVTAKDCYDVSTFGDHIELLLECVVCGIGSINGRFCAECWTGCSDLLYCQYCPGSSHCFGCISLRKKSHCILNKQYTKEQYEDLVPKLIAHMRRTKEWGEFFPMSLSPMAYNDTTAQRYFPLTKKEVLVRGLRWHDEHIQEAAQAIDAAALPDGLPQTDDPIIVKSALSGQPFKITTQEIKRYRQSGLPLPRTTYDERMEERTRKLGGIRLYDRVCAKTGKPIKTAYPPDSPWIIWDKDVYDQEFGG